MNPPAVGDFYSTRLEECLWGILLVSLTLAMHGFGMVVTLRAINGIKARVSHPSFWKGMTIIILASWMILVFHMAEVGIWAHFFLWKKAVAGAVNNSSLCFYFALMDYTTLGSNYNLVLDWRLLEGTIGIAGLLTFAWSTGILMTLAQEFQERQLALLKERGEKAGQSSKGKPAA
jgi:hypothetical protein